MVNKNLGCSIQYISLSIWASLQIEPFLYHLYWVVLVQIEQDLRMESIKLKAPYLQFVPNHLSFYSIKYYILLFKKLKRDVYNMLFLGISDICAYSLLCSISISTKRLSDEEGNANNDMEEEAVNFSIKYLTSSKPMGLVVSNANNY